MSKNLDALKRLRVKSCFGYHEEKVKPDEIMFGWQSISRDKVELPFVVSYGSKAKDISDEDLSWSNEAGVNAASLSDYRRYFKSLTGDSAEDFYEKWEEKEAVLEELREKSNPSYREGEGAFLIALANLLNSGKKFTKYGRIFKLIE